MKTLNKINDKSSSSNADLGRNIDELLSEIALTSDAKDLLKRQYGKVQDHYRYIRYYTKEQIFSKAVELKGNSDLDIYLVTALMNKANKIATGYELRPAQILSTLEFFRESGGLNKFCQVNTGEGKTTLTSLIAVIKALQGDTVDIITSNEVLAKDAVRDRGDFYALFGFSVAHNNADHRYEKGTRDCYKQDIVYGTIGNFEFDYLRNLIKLSDVKGNRQFGSLIIDEADNVVLDNAAQIAKLSGPIAGMEYLKYIYLNIWQALIKAEQILGLQDTEIDQITIEDRKLIKAVMSIGVKASINNSLIPKFLESYVERKLDSWINNAIKARYDYHQHQHYLIGKKNTEQSDINAEENVIPLDIGVGVTLQNTVWTDLHPFIQIKHNLQVTPDSLSSIFIANSEYIRLYKNVSGLTGTLGSQKEREIIKTLYNASSTIIPTYKTGMIEYKTNKVVRDRDWTQEIAKDAMEHAVDKKRASLVVCETIQDVLDVKARLVQNEQARVITYLNEHDAYKIESINNSGGIKPGTIVIATNIGGRGTDIKLSDIVKANGGLHECTTFIASSSRILKQASGRAARQGEPGSSRIIIKESDLEKYGINLGNNFSNEDIYNLVDVINDTKISKFIPQIKRAEQNAKYFSEFADLYTKNKLLGMNHFVLEDLRLQWALAFDAGNVVEIKKLFTKLAKAADNIKDYEHQFINPYFAIKYVDSILSTGVVKNKTDKKANKDNINNINNEDNINEGNNEGNRDKQEDELYDRAKRILNQECITQDPELLYAASMKNFEIIISQRQKNKLKQLANGIIASTGQKQEEKWEEEEEEQEQEEKEDKKQLKTYLENAQKILTKRVAYLQDMIDSEDFHHVTLAKNYLNNNGKNYMLKHIESKHTLLQLQLQHVTSLIEWINNSNDESLCISGKYNFNELIKYTTNDAELKIHKEELNQSRGLGEDSFYKLSQLPNATVDNPTTKAAIQEISSSFAKSALNFTFTKSVMPTADDLIDSGIFDIMKVILTQAEDFKSKAENYLLDALSFGFGSMVKSLRILHQVSDHVSKTITAGESKFLSQFAPEIKKQLAISSEKYQQIIPKGLLKLPKKLSQVTFDETRALEGSLEDSLTSSPKGNKITKNHDINGINSYFGKYTLDAIKSILQLRIKDAGINNAKVVSNNYSFIDSDNNNIANLFGELESLTDESIVLVPLSLSNSHAVGLMFKKQQDISKLYYIDPENHKIPAGLEQIFREYQGHQQEHQLDIKQLTVENQRYANCGPEVIENFMLYLTGARLPQETAICYHSLLVEQNLLNSNEYTPITIKDTILEDKHVDIADIIGFSATTDAELEVSALGLSPDLTLDSIFEILS